MEDFLAGFSCPESPLENRISGFYTHIGSISPAGAVRVLCAFFLSEGFEHFVFMVTQPRSSSVWMGSPAVYCRGRARWAKQIIPKCHCLSGLVQGHGKAYRTLICSARKSNSVAPGPSPWICSLAACFREQVRPGAKANNLSHLLNNLQSLLLNGDDAVLLAPGHKPQQYSATKGDLHMVLGSKQGVFLSYNRHKMADEYFGAKLDFSASQTLSSADLSLLQYVKFRDGSVLDLIVISVPYLRFGWIG